jgi:O-antigen/teichoic acid export membrane protein
MQFDGGSRYSLATTVLVMLAVGSAVAYSILRGGVLSLRSSRWFAVFSAAPAVIVLLILLAALLLQAAIVSNPTFLAGAFVAAYLCCAMVGMLPFREGQGPAEPGALDWRRLMQFGIASWVPTICQSGAVFFALHWVEHVQDTASTGALAAALALAAIAITPLNLASPLLFKEWTLQERSRRRAEFVGAIGLVVLGTAVFSAVVYLFGEWLVQLLFGPSYLPFVSLFALISLIVGPQSMTKLWGVFCSASGRPWLSMIVDVLKIALVVTSLLAFARTVWQAALAWVVCEYLALTLGASALWLFRLQPRGAR